MSRDVAFEGRSKTVLWAREYSGKCRGKEYFQKLSMESRAVFQARFERLGNAGEIRNPAHFKSERDGLYCIKIKGHRLLCFIDGSDVVITHGFKKRDDKMPKRERERAIRIRTEWLERKEHK